MDMITVTARAVDKAATKVLIELETTSDRLRYEVVGKGSIGFLGIGVKPAIIRVKKEESIENKAIGFLSQIFEAMNIQVSTMAAYNQKEQELSLNLEGENMGILIGRRGQTLDFLQYLVSLIVNKGTEGYLRTKLDTKNYRKGRKETLETLAKNIVCKAKRTKRSVSLELMNSYEERIIHTALQNGKHITTRSEGEEPFRRVVTMLKREAAPGDRKGRYGRNKEGRYERSDCSGGYRNSRRTNGDNVSQISSDASAEIAAGEEE